MKKSLIIGAGILVVLGLGAMGSNKDHGQSHSKEESSKKVSSSSTQTVVKKSNITVNNFDKIVLGSNGASKSDVEKMFDKQPASTSQSQLNGTSVELCTWHDVEGQGVTSFVTVQYQNGRAVGKSINGLKNPSKVSVNQYNNIPGNESETALIKLLGNPEGKSYTNIGGVQSTTLTYKGNGGIGSNAVVTITNGNVVSKSQTDLK